MGIKSAGKESGICPVGKQYDTLNDIAKAFGLHTGSLRAPLLRYQTNHSI